MKLNKFVAGVALVAALGLGSIATTQTAHAAEGYKCSLRGPLGIENILQELTTPPQKP